MFLINIQNNLKEEKKAFTGHISKKLFVYTFVNNFLALLLYQIFNTIFIVLIFRLEM